jgi:hypothetical protein
MQLNIKNAESICKGSNEEVIIFKEYQETKALE